MSNHDLELITLSQVKLRISEDVLTISQHDETESSTEIRGDSILLLAATYYTILLRRVGGSETFQEKKEFFNAELTKYHEDQNHRHLRLPLRVDRANIFETTWKATRYFLQSDWARLFEIYFSGELGIDQVRYVQRSHGTEIGGFHDRNNLLVGTSILYLIDSFRAWNPPIYPYPMKTKCKARNAPSWAP